MEQNLPEIGATRAFMARDSAASEHSIQRVLYTKAHERRRALMEKNLFLFCSTKFNGLYKLLIINIDRGGAHNILQVVEKNRDDNFPPLLLSTIRNYTSLNVVIYQEKNVFVNYDNNNIIKQLRA